DDTACTARPSSTPDCCAGCPRRSSSAWAMPPGSNASTAAARTAAADGADGHEHTEPSRSRERSRYGGIGMKERIREILSWYGSDNPGTLTNLARMLNHGRLGGSGRMVILPVDQGFEHGPARSFAPNPAGYDPRYHFELGIGAGCNAYAAPLGFL